jgi:hypothetical protein
MIQEKINQLKALIEQDNANIKNSKDIINLAKSNIKTLIKVKNVAGLLTMDVSARLYKECDIAEAEYTMAIHNM